MSLSALRRVISIFKAVIVALCLSTSTIAQSISAHGPKTSDFVIIPANAGDGTDAVAVVLEQRRYFGFESVCRFVSVSQRASHEWHVEWICEGEGQTHRERVTLRVAGNQLTIRGADGAGNTLSRCPARK